MSATPWWQLASRGVLPLNIGIKAGHVDHSIGVLIINFQCPDGGGIRGLRYLQYPRTMGTEIGRCSFIEEHVRAGKHSVRPAPEGIRGLVRPLPLGGQVSVVYLEDGSRAVARRLAVGAAGVAALIQHAIIAIVEHGELKIAGRV